LPCLDLAGIAAASGSGKASPPIAPIVPQVWRAPDQVTVDVGRWQTEFEPIIVRLFDCSTVFFLLPTHVLKSVTHVDEVCLD
jgi:hypothetical protein